MKKWYLIIFVLMLLVCPQSAQAAAKVQVSLPECSVTLNGVAVDNLHRQYPLLTYQEMVYFPLTYSDSRFMGLETCWTAEKGLLVERTGVSAIYQSGVGADNSGVLWAEQADFPIEVQGEDVSSEKRYPFLVFRGVTYMPLTDHYSTALLGWRQSYAAQTGLTITADNPRIQTLPLEGALGSFVLQGQRLWTVEGQGVVNRLLTEPDKHTVVRTLGQQLGETGQRVESAWFKRQGADDYAVITCSGLPQPTWSYFRLLPDGGWERTNEGRYRFDNWEVTIAQVDHETRGNLLITSLENQKAVAADEQYHYYTDSGGWEAQEFIYHEGMLYLLAHNPNSQKGTLIAQVQLQTGAVKIIGHGLKMVRDGDWLYYAGFDEEACRDAYYRYSLTSGQTERVAVNRQTYDMSMANVYTALNGRIYYTDFPEQLMQPEQKMSDEEREAYSWARYASSHYGDWDLYRQGEEKSMNPGGKVMELAQAGDYVYAVCTPRTAMAKEPYRLMVFDRAGRVVFKTTDAAAKVSLSGDQLVYSLEGDGQAENRIYYVALKQSERSS